MKSSLTPEIEKVKPWAENTYALAEKILGDKSYVSLVVERRWNRNFDKDPKAQNFHDDVTMGWVLRAFDGRTMFERAGDQFTKAAMEKAVSELDGEVKRLFARYTPPSWKERLKPELEREILSQVPGDATPENWVHFGTAMAKPIPKQNSEIMNWVVGEYDLTRKDLAAAQQTLDFVKVMYRLAIEEFMFIDSSVRMSQSLVRPSRILVAVRGDNQIKTAKGSLGGAEVFEREEATGTQALLEKLEKIEKADRLKPGRYKVLLSPTLTGVFAHEAFGHSQEADTWMRGRSKARELYETQVRVGNDLATIANNPAIYKNGAETTGAWGSYFFDEEGWLAEKQILVERGYLRPPMTDLTSSFRLKLPRSSNGKRQDWTHGMYSRQTNTYFEVGDQTFNDLIAQMDYGFLANESFGGMEDPKGMGIQVGVRFLEEVRDGKLTGKTFVAPNGGAVQITGSVEEYLNSILGVSKIEAFSEGPDESSHPWNEVGGCGKYHKEFVKAGCGGTYLLLDQVILG